MVLRRTPVRQAAYAHWRAMWAELAADPDIKPSQFATRHGVSLRPVQWIRSIGPHRAVGLPGPLVLRLADLAGTNGHLSTAPKLSS